MLRLVGDWGWLAGIAWLGWFVVRGPSHRTYRFSELPIRDGRLKDRTYVDCSFRGPGAFYMLTMPTNGMQTPYGRNVWMLGIAGLNVNDIKGGVVVVENCQFIRCRFYDLAFLAEPAVITAMGAVMMQLPPD